MRLLLDVVPPVAARGLRHLDLSNGEFGRYNAGAE